MSWFPSWEGILVATTVMVLVRTVWVWRRHDDNRLRRILGAPIGPSPFKKGEYFMSGTSGASRAEVERALSPEYASRYARLMTPGARKTIVSANVLVWLLVIYGGFDLPGGFGLADSHLSWWGVLTIPAWWLARMSARVIADAPAELLDERLLAVRNHSYYEAYRLLGVFVSASVIVAIVLDIASTSNDVSLTTSSWVSMVVTVPFVSIWALSSLPSLMVITHQAMDEGS